jgi:hypothetical protein
MSRKNYEEFAEVLGKELAQCDTPEETRAVAKTIKAIAGIFKRDNSAFQNDRFLSAVTAHEQKARKESIND